MRPILCDSDEVVTTRSARIWLGKDGICRVEAFPGSTGELEDAIANVGTVSKLCGGMRRPLLVDMRGQNSMKREGRLYYSSSDESLRTISAVALLVNSPLARMIANIFIGINKARMPIRLVGSEEEGLAWLRGFLK